MHKALSSLKEVFLLTRGNLYLSLFHELETQFDRSDFVNRVVPTKLHMARIWSTCCWGCKFEECGAKFKLTVVPQKMTPIHYVKLYQDPYQEK